MTESKRRGNKEEVKKEGLIAAMTKPGYPLPSTVRPFVLLSSILHPLSSIPSAHCLSFPLRFHCSFILSLFPRCLLFTQPLLYREFAFVSRLSPRVLPISLPFFRKPLSWHAPAPALQIPANSLISPFFRYSIFHFVDWNRWVGLVVSCVDTWTLPFYPGLILAAHGHATVKLSARNSPSSLYMSLFTPTRFSVISDPLGLSLSRS